jgi:ribosomal protein L7Ae-like RNA K-turn-binding protein
MVNFEEILDRTASLEISLLRKVKQKCNVYSTQYVIITVSRRLGCAENVKSGSTQKRSGLLEIKNEDLLSRRKFQVHGSVHQR